MEFCLPWLEAEDYPRLLGKNSNFTLSVLDVGAINSSVVRAMDKHRMQGLNPSTGNGVVDWISFIQANLIQMEPYLPLPHRAVS